MTRLTVRHVTLYRYRRPVGFGEHRLMFRPRDSHDLRLVRTALTIEPAAEVRWLHDVFSNSIAIASFRDQATELRFESEIEIEHYGLDDPEFQFEPAARTYPFSYSSEEVPDLGRTIERHYPDPKRRVDAWAKGFLGSGGQTDTADLLARITRTINRQFGYQIRYAVGTRSPLETLEQGHGTCRDLALFMMEAVRSLGLAARFVSGYLYDPASDGGGGDTGLRGLGATHAWVQVYLPGAGWVEFDPTNGLVGGANLIRVGVARDPSQAIPLQGSYFGAPEDFIDMQVDVKVAAAAD
jgi:transglutaminase-like putative cysteine protease